MIRVTFFILAALYIFSPVANSQYGLLSLKQEILPFLKGEKYVLSSLDGTVILDDLESKSVAIHHNYFTIDDGVNYRTFNAEGKEFLKPIPNTSKFHFNVHSGITYYTLPNGESVIFDADSRCSSSPFVLEFNRQTWQRKHLMIEDRKANWEKYTIINNKGKRILPNSTITYIKGYTYGTYIVDSLSNKYFLLYDNSRIISNAVFRKYPRFTHHIVSSADSSFIISNSGETKLAVPYNNAVQQTDTTLSYYDGNETVLISIYGREIERFNYEQIRVPRNGHKNALIVGNSDGSFGIIDSTGNSLVPQEYLEISEFGNGFSCRNSQEVIFYSASFDSLNCIKKIETPYYQYTNGEYIILKSSDANSGYFVVDQNAKLLCPVKFRFTPEVEKCGFIINRADEENIINVYAFSGEIVKKIDRTKSTWTCEEGNKLKIIHRNGGEDIIESAIEAMPNRNNESVLDDYEKIPLQNSFGFNLLKKDNLFGLYNSKEEILFPAMYDSIQIKGNFGVMMFYKDNQAFASSIYSMLRGGKPVFLGDMPVKYVNTVEFSHVFEALGSEKRAFYVIKNGKKYVTPHSIVKHTALGITPKPPLFFAKIEGIKKPVLCNLETGQVYYSRN